MAHQSSVIARSDDAPELTQEQLAEMRPAREVLSGEQFAAVTGRGRPKLEDPKVPVTIRLSREVVEAYKADGKGWQTRINDTLLSELKSRHPSKGARDKTVAGQRISGGEFKAVGQRGSRGAGKARVR